MSDPVRILIADDHGIVREGLKSMLENHPGFAVVGEAEDGAQAIASVEHSRPDVILMDLRMPNVDGVDATRQILASHPEINVLVLTTYDADADILSAIEAGACGYLLKDVSRQELLRALEAAARGESVLAPPIAARLLGHLRSPDQDALSQREIEVLELVADGVSNREVGRALHISEATVKTHLHHIYRKLDVPDRAAAVTEAFRRGVLRIA